MSSLATVEDPTELTTVALGETEARALTERIREHVNVIESHLHTFSDLLAQAEDGRVWEALGYATLDAYTKAEFGFGRAQLFRLKRAAKVEERLSEAAGAPLRLREGTLRGMSDAQVEVVAAGIREEMGGRSAAEAPEVVAKALEQERARSPLAPRRYAEQPADVVDAVAAEIADPHIPEDEPIPATRPAPKGRRISDESVLQLADALDRLAGIGIHAEDMARGMTAKQAAMLPSLEDAYQWLHLFHEGRKVA
jgi:hypothetical protein